MRVLITGGAGFIGCRLAGRLVARGDEVVVVDNLHPQVHHGAGRPLDLPEVATLLPLDVTDPDQVDRALRLAGPVDTIVHLAAETGTGQSLTEASRHGRVNVVGTTELIDALTRAELRPSRVVLSSSRAVYGEGTWIAADGTRFSPSPRRDAQLARGEWDVRGADGSIATPAPHAADRVWPRPTNVYAATKLAQEHVLSAWCSSFDVPLGVLRLQNVYGPGQALANAYTGVLTYFARQIASGEQVEVYEGGGIVRDFVFVDDVVDALMAALDRAGASAPVVDIGSGRPATLLDVATAMCDIAAVGAPVVVDRYRLGDVRSAWASVDAAEACYGWTPATNLRDGLTRLLEWALAHFADGGPASPVSTGPRQ